MQRRYDLMCATAHRNELIRQAIKLVAGRLNFDRNYFRAVNGQNVNSIAKTADINLMHDPSFGPHDTQTRNNRLPNFTFRFTSISWHSAPQSN
jgi:hypothetical protein